MGPSDAHLRRAPRRRVDLLALRSPPPRAAPLHRSPSAAAASNRPHPTCSHGEDSGGPRAYSPPSYLLTWRGSGGPSANPEQSCWMPAMRSVVATTAGMRRPLWVDGAVVARGRRPGKGKWRRHWGGALCGFDDLRSLPLQGCNRRRRPFSYDRLPSGHPAMAAVVWYVSNVSIIFDAQCLFLHHLPIVSLHFVALLCIFRN
jgi:hypothetical protein